jgi:hypothetical protein
MYWMWAVRDNLLDRGDGIVPEAGGGATVCAGGHDGGVFEIGAKEGCFLERQKNSLWLGVRNLEISESDGGKPEIWRFRSPRLFKEERLMSGFLCKRQRIAVQYM